ncbi:MAG TPA: hypothetical protein DCL43_06610 [Chitinophagaceae bacterium]|nr:hypothetical protein [Chitinophagaceae bacterium]HAN38500.1 hypothetical protein [Chitinophagaceae bacterium]
MLLKKLGGLLFVALVLLSAACNDQTRTGCSNVDPSKEDAALLAFCNANGMVGATKDASGMYFTVVSPGSGPRPNNGSTVRVLYTGKKMDGTVFDSQTDINRPASFGMTGVIQAFQQGLLKIRKQGTVRIVAPSYMCYGCRGSGNIGPNEPLYFEIYLVDVQ